MTTTYLLRGGRLVDPSEHRDGRFDLLVHDGRVADVAPVLTPPADLAVIDVEGLIVSPGFVDLHTHLRFPGFPDKETLRTGTEAAAAGGFTTVCAMANTQPVVDSVEVLRDIEQAAVTDARVRMHQLASVSLGLRGETLTDMRALAAAGAIGFSDDGKPIWNQALMRRALGESMLLDRPVSVHEEDPPLVAGGVVNAGDAARRHRLPPWPCGGEASMLARDLELLEDVGGRLHVAHVSCAESVNLLRRARRRELPVTAEVTPHHLRLTDTLLGGDARLGLAPGHPCTKVNPPLRSQRDVDSLVEALADGTIDAVATDHAPHAAADKDRPYIDAAFGISGIETALPLVLELVRHNAVTLSTAVERLTIGPARVFGLTAGSLSIGTPADLCVFDPERRWTVAADALRSLGKNTPLLGAELRGRVVLTAVGGQIVHALEDAPGANLRVVR